jgi:hypothetical protein
LIDPKTVLIATPAYDFKHVSGYSGGLAACAWSHLFGQMAFEDGCADIRMARSLLTYKFLDRSSYEWLVWIDADIAFGERDFRILMDYEPSKAYDRVPPKEPQLEPSRTAGGDDLIVSAEYARKVAGEPQQVRFGLGFSRIHRSVLLAILELKDGDGNPRVGFFDWKDLIQVPDLYPTGPGFNRLYFTEDHGFFHLCKLAGFTPRVERRTRLFHWGANQWPYLPADEPIMTVDRHGRLVTPAPVAANT